MENTTFQSARLKVERANHHITDMSSQIASYLDTNQGQFWTQGDPWKGSGSIGHNALPAPEIFNIMVGDIAHNLRSALDHVAGEITIMGGGNDSALMASKFPMSVNPEAFEQSVASKIHPFNPAIAACLISEMQSTNGRYDVLNSINKLNNTDKHRSVVVILTQVAVKIKEFKIGGLTVRNMEAIGGSALIGNFGGQPIEFEEDPYATVSVVFGDSEGFEGQPVIPTLINAAQAVLDIIELCASQVA